MFSGMSPGWIPSWGGYLGISVCVEGTAAAWRPDVLWAFNSWRVLTRVAGTEVVDCARERTVAYRESGLSGALGVGAYPPPLIMEPWAGDVWIARGLEPELRRAVLLHETGHAFGLPDSLDTRDVMHPDVARWRRMELSSSEHRMMGCLYREECR